MPAVVDPPPVGGPPHLRGHLVEGEVERGHLVDGRRLGADHRTLGERRELDSDGAVTLARVGFAVHLDLHPHDAVVVLLEPGQLLLDVAAIPVGDLAVSAGDHNIHVNLPCRRCPVGPGRPPENGRARESPGLSVLGWTPYTDVSRPSVATEGNAALSGMTSARRPGRGARPPPPPPGPTSRPRLPSARWASRAVDPVVSTSSHDHHPASTAAIDPQPGGPASDRARPGRLRCPACRVEPAWSTTPAGAGAAAALDGEPARAEQSEPPVPWIVWVGRGRAPARARGAGTGCRGRGGRAARRHGSRGRAGPVPRRPRGGAGPRTRSRRTSAHACLRPAPAPARRPVVDRPAGSPSPGRRRSSATSERRASEQPTRAGSTQSTATRPSSRPRRRRSSGRGVRERRSRPRAHPSQREGSSERCESGRPARWAGRGHRATRAGSADVGQHGHSRVESIRSPGAGQVAARGPARRPTRRRRRRRSAGPGAGVPTRPITSSSMVTGRRVETDGAVDGRRADLEPVAAPREQDGEAGRRAPVDVADLAVELRRGR